MLKRSFTTKKSGLTNTKIDANDDIVLIVIFSSPGSPVSSLPTELAVEACFFLSQN